MYLIIPLLLSINFILWFRVKDSSVNTTDVNLALGSIILSIAVIGILVTKELIPLYHFWLMLLFNSTIGIWVMIVKWTLHQLKSVFTLFTFASNLPKPSQTKSQPKKIRFSDNFCRMWHLFKYRSGCETQPEAVKWFFEFKKLTKKTLGQKLSMNQKLKLKNN